MYFQVRWQKYNNRLKLQGCWHERRHPDQLYLPLYGMRKKDDSKPQRDKKFLALPEYPGGKEALQAFIRTHLRYPEEALSRKIEGTVHVQYWVDGQGRVSEAEVTHGIGGGCDEEALRVISMLRYGKVKNRGLKVKASMKTRIEFKLPAQPALQFHYTTQATKQKTGDPQPARPSYTYSIRIPGPDKPVN